MRAFLLFLGWSSVIGSFFDGALALYALWINHQADWQLLNISVDNLLAQYIEFIYWVKQVAYYVMPETIVIWLFNLPALVYFPIRIVTSIWIGYWALAKAEQIRSKTND